jgi:cobalt-zinc-cadmium efflux system membrane fusion protein
MTHHANHAVVVLTVLLAGCQSDGGSSESGSNRVPDPTIIEISAKARWELAIEPAQPKPVAESLTFPGRIQYSLDGYVKIATPLVGIVRSVQGRLGEHVKAGQPLVFIESADIGMAYSDFAKAESDLHMTQRYLEIAKDLYAVKSLSKKEYDQAQNDFNKAHAEFTRAKQRLLTLRVSASELEKPAPERHVSTRFDLRSPLNGIIVEKTVTVGQVVGQDPTQTLFTIADPDVLQVVADVYERDLRLLHPGMPTTVTIESFPQDTFSGRVIYVGDIVDPTSRTIKIRCEVKNTGYKLKPEMFARVHVQLGSTAAGVVVPREAVLRIGDGAFVFVEVNETQFQQRAVVTGPTTGEMVEIRDGITSGEPVVVRGAVLLKGALEKRTS